MNNIVLFDEYPIMFDRVLARVIGRNEAIVLQQIHYWLKINERQKINFYNDRYWVFGSIRKWHEESFDYVSVDTVKRTFKNLEKKGILITDNFNKKKFDKTKWYSIDYEMLAKVKEEYDKKQQEKEKSKSKKVVDNNVNIVDNYENALGQNAPSVDAKCTNALGQNAPMQRGNLHQPIQYTNKDINKEINALSKSERKSNKEIIESLTDLKINKTVASKVETWNKERLLKAIESFNEKNGMYFTLLEKIYNEGDIKKVGPRKNTFKNFDETVSRYTDDELNKLIKASQENKFGKKFV